MPAPVPSWNLVRLYGTWRGMGGELKQGTYTVTVPARITNSTNDAIIPAGVFAAGALQTSVDGSPSMDLQVPATDDPDNEQSGWKLVVAVKFPDASAENYVIDVPIADRPIIDGGTGDGVNLRRIALAAQIPQQIALYRVGVPGGLARLDADGDVIDAYGVKILAGGGGSGSTVVDNGDGTFTMDGSLYVDNGDGTFTLSGPALTDNGDGTFTLAA